MDKMKIDYLTDLERDSIHASDNDRIKYAFETTDLADLTCCISSKYPDHLSNAIVYPRIKLPDEVMSFISNKDAKISTIEFGEYPQNGVDETTYLYLERLYRTKSDALKVTGNSYTIPNNIITQEKEKTIKLPNGEKSNVIHMQGRVFAKNCIEFKVNNEKYIRYVDDEYSLLPIVNWFKVSPIKWDYQDGYLYSRIGVFNNLFITEDINKNKKGLSKISRLQPSKEETINFLEDHFLKDILQTVKLSKAIKYNNFKELNTIIKNNGGISTYNKASKIILDGPELNKSELESIKHFFSPKAEIIYGNSKDLDVLINGMFSEEISNLVFRINNDMELTLLSPDYIEKTLKNMYDLRHNPIHVTDFAKKIYLTFRNSILDSYPILLSPRKGEFNNCLFSKWFMDNNGVIFKALDQKNNNLYFNQYSSIELLPVIKSKNLVKKLLPNASRQGYYYEVEFGEYPQEEVEVYLMNHLDFLFKNNELKKTGRIYQLDSSLKEKCYEYEYNGEKYVYVQQKGSVKIWYKVKGITWLIDEKNDLLISKDVLLMTMIKNEKSIFIDSGIYTFLNNKMFINSFSIEKEKMKTVIEEEQTKEYPKDIQNLLDKINSICDGLPNNAKKKITDQVKELLKQYDNGIQKLKPKFNHTNELVIGQDDIYSLKPSLLSKLEIININLTNEDKTIKFLEELSNYKKIISQNNTQFIKDNDSIETKINNIIFMTNEMNDDKKQLYLNELNTIIDNSIKELSKLLEEGIDDKPDISLPKNFDVDKTFKLNISKLYDKVLTYYEKNVPFEKLLNSLINNNGSTNIDITNIISGIEEVIKVLIENNSDYKDEIENRFNTLIAENICILESLLNDSKSLNKTKYDEIEKNLKNDLQDLLKLIKKYNVLESINIKSHLKYTKDNLLEQLKESKDIINKEDAHLSNYDELKAITSTVIETYNYLIDNISDINTIREVKDLLNEIIDNEIIELNDIQINNYKDYNKYLYEVLGKLMDVRLQIEIYIYDLKTYKKIIK
ncbi:MAG: hypothetical protein VZS44_01295 [Bacilli bacterium]|nr:hypothetical protein [Bacilli bacterium]